MQALAATPAIMSPRSRFVVPPFLNKKSRRAYKNEKITLPLHINWSHRGLVFDMSRESSRAQLYEKVLREGSVKDIEHFIPFKDLRKLWSIMFLPSDLQQAWESIYPELRESYAHDNSNI